jgi:hypothetical protein
MKFELLSNETSNHFKWKHFWESPFIPSHSTFKKVKISLTVNQSNNHNYLINITFQNLEFWDVTHGLCMMLCFLCFYVCARAVLISYAKRVSESTRSSEKDSESEINRVTWLLFRE